jgi:hypothetical protein
MSATKRNEKSALRRLAAPDVELDLDRDGRSFALYRGIDRRRRAIARIAPSEMRAWLAAGLIARIEGRSGYSITPAGRAAAQREAAPELAFLAQHGDLIERQIIDADGAFRPVRGFDPHIGLKRLSAIRGGDGRAFFSSAELRAATLLRQDWEQGLAGQIKGADWSAPPRGGIAHGPGIAAEAAMATGCDARRRVEMALARLAQPLRRVVERVCLHEEGIEALERGEGWPARSGKIALKLGLAQLALGC